MSLLLSAGSIPLWTSAAGVPEARLRLTEDWKFIRFESAKDEPAGLHELNLEDAHWQHLNLPHDWGIQGNFQPDLPNRTAKLAWHGIGWYRKSFLAPKLGQGERLLVEFEGAMSHPQIWLNGELVGEWAYGYSSFFIDLTPALMQGRENVLAVRLDNPPESSRWYPGGGLYRDVWLVIHAAVSLGEWGPFITTPEVGENSARVEISSTISNRLSDSVKVRLRHTLLGPDGMPVASVTTDPVEVPAGSSKTQNASVGVFSPQLWGVDSPVLYSCKSEVLSGDTVYQEWKSSFGIRSIEWTVAEGFFLNGKLVELKGVCQHHDLGALGGAFNLRAAERQLEILREMGCNAIRMAHNPPAPGLLDLCDRMGFLVVNELFDTWALNKTPGDYGSDYEEWHERDVRNWVRRDRNHPSIIAWSLGNEVREQSGNDGDFERADRLVELTKEEDVTRPVTVGMSKGETIINGFAQIFDVAGYNYKAVAAKSPNYATHFRVNPTQPAFGAETSSCVSSRGEYFFPQNEAKNGGFFDFQVSSYDWYAPPWAYRPDIEFDSQDRYPALAGEFVWTGFDYLGEPTPYNRDSTNLLNFSDHEDRKAMMAELERLGSGAPSRSSYFGIIDLAGFPKDRYYLYQSRWRPDYPVAHILPHWNWEGREGEITPVHIYTNGDEAELFLNGQSFGRKRKGPREYRLIWPEFVYQAGELKVIAYRDGEPWATGIRETSGKAAQLRVSVDRSQLAADGRDLAFFKIEILDAEGRTVPDADPQLHFEVNGAGEFVAADNGNATDWTPFFKASRNAFNGLALAIVKGRQGIPGTATLRVTSPGLEPAELSIEMDAPAL